MGPTHGTKHRIMEQNRYNPSSVNKAYRRERVTTAYGSTQTYKKEGDKIITDRGSFDVEQEGFQS